MKTASLLTLGQGRNIVIDWSTTVVIPEPVKEIKPRSRRHAAKLGLTNLWQLRHDYLCN